MISHTVAHRAGWAKLTDYLLADRLACVFVSRKACRRDPQRIEIPRDDDAERVAASYERLFNSALESGACSVVAIHWDARRDGINVIVSHGTFPRTEDGNVLPLYNLEWDSNDDRYTLIKQEEFT